MNLTPELIAAIGTAIISPIIAYLKVKGDTQKRTEKRNEQLAVLEQRVKEVEKKCDAIDDLRDAINKMSNAITKIQTMLEMYIKHHDKD